MKKKRIEKGLSTRFVAERIGVSPSTYTDWENGRQIRGEEHYIKITEVLEMSLSELFFDRPRTEFEESLLMIEEAVKRIRNLL